MLTRVRYAWAIALGAALAGLGCASAAPHLDPWLEVRTPNFVVLSPRSEAATLELARDLERFRSVVELVTGKRIPASRVPLRVYALDAGTYRSYGAPGIAGFFFDSPRRNTIVLGAGRRGWGEARVVLQHEYVHFLLRNRTRYAYPPWYDEGFAEFLSNVEMGPEGILVGRPLRQRIATLPQVGWLPVGEVLSRRSFEGLREDQLAAFYSESWLLVHYLNLGRESVDTRAELALYLKGLREGLDDEQAARRAFGADSATLGHRLQRYLQADRYSYVTIDPEHLGAAAEPQLRALSPAEVASALGWLSLHVGKFEQAQRHYRAALAADPGDARALSGSAAALSGQQQWAAAEARFAQALAAGADDPVVHLDYANYLHGRATEESDASARQRLALEAREHYVRSWKLDDSIPETYAAYGQTFLLEGEEVARGLETLEHAHRMLPSSVEIKIALARLYAKLGRPQQARELALVASTWSHSSEHAEDIQALLEELKASDPDGKASPGKGQPGRDDR